MHPAFAKSGHILAFGGQEVTALATTDKNALTLSLLVHPLATYGITCRSRRMKTRGLHDMYLYVVIYVASYKQT